MSFEFLLPSALGAIGTYLQGQKKAPVYQAPQPTSSRPQYQAPTYQQAPGYQSAGGYKAPAFQAGPQYNSPGQYQGVGNYQAPSPTFQPLQGPLYQSLLQNFQGVQAGGSALPEAYRQAVLQQAQSALGAQKSQDVSGAVEDANKYGLLGSGSLGIRLGKIDQGYAREYGNVANQLTQADLAERQNLIGNLSGLQGQQLQLEPLLQQGAYQGYQSQVSNRDKEYQSLADLADKLFGAGQGQSDRINEFMSSQAARDYDARAGEASGANQYGLSTANAANQFNLGNAGQQYQSQASAWDAEQQRQQQEALAKYQGELARYQGGQQNLGNLFGFGAAGAQSYLNQGVNQQNQQYQLQLLQQLLGQGGSAAGGGASNFLAGSNLFGSGAKGLFG